MTPSDKAIRDTLLTLALARGAGKSFCPSEAARALAADWRELMPCVRCVAAQMQDEGILLASQRGQPVQADTAKGPIRLRLATGQDTPEP